MGGTHRLRGQLRLGSVALLTAAVLVLSPAPAPGGGWFTWIDLPSSVLTTGREVTAREQVLFETLGAAQRASEGGAYYAYLLDGVDFEMVHRAMSRDFRPDWWRPGTATRILLGPVTLSGGEANFVRARASFTVPDVAPGRYALMFCDAGCRTSLADIIPTRVTVVSDPLTARIAQRLRALQRRDHRQHRALFAEVRRLSHRVTLLEGRLEERVLATPTPPGAASQRGVDSELPALLGSTGVVVALGMAAFLWRRRRSPKVAA